jgi:hypothetical protein
LGISYHGGCLWSTDKDYRKLVPILAHCVTSVSSLASDFGHGLALDFGFGFDHMQFVNCWGLSHYNIIILEGINKLKSKFLATTQTKTNSQIWGI